MKRSIYLFYFLSMATHLLVIAKIIPFYWVNGGMSESYNQQAVQSLVSIVIIGVLFIFVKKILQSKETQKWHKIFLRTIIIVLVLGLVMQLLGTMFEKFVMSPILVLGVITHILLAKYLVRSGKNTT